ncbi:hypothetical protein Pla108_19490 [Botrimarina colliarenosi]|uniref:Uncharacterized protein n=1 Tax=Botrimarina colliarenosi TaxID=2528001 RepID=A0A5C6AEG0_9BACT|nr:hypothetical protein Pla108_19490 [Botrimarina colliarenosi]
MARQDGGTTKARRPQREKNLWEGSPTPMTAGWPFDLSLRKLFQGLAPLATRRRPSGAVAHDYPSSDRRSAAQPARISGATTSARLSGRRSLYQTNLHASSLTATTCIEAAW